MWNPKVILLERTRTEKTIINLTYAMLCQFIIFILEFYMRKEFSSVLGEVYLGLDSTFDSVLMMISASNLGIVSAIAYSLYKPLAEADEKRLKAAFKFLRNSCWFMGIFFGVCGIIFSYRLNLILNNADTILNIKIIYLFYLANVILPYFFAHRRWLILNDQRRYIVILNSFISTVLGLLAKLIFLGIYKSFLIFSICILSTTLIEGVITFVVSNRLYPFLKYKITEKLTKSEKKIILKNVKGAILNQAFGLVIHTTDSIYISKIAGIIVAGIYAPYKFIINALKTINWQFCESIAASFGNLAAEGDIKKLEKRFYDVLFIGNCFFSAVVCNLIVNFSPLINIWMPKNHIFDNKVVAIILFNFYLMGIHKIVKTIRDNMGIYWPARYITICEAIINLAVSYFGVKFYGIAGILGGTTISILATCFWWEPYLLYKHGFKTKLTVYFKKQFLYYALTFVCCYICVNLCKKLVTQVVWARIFYNTLIVLIVQGFIFFVAFKNSEEYLFFKELICSKLGKRSC